MVTELETPSTVNDEIRDGVIVSSDSVIIHLFQPVW